MVSLFAAISLFVALMFPSVAVDIAPNDPAFRFVGRFDHSQVEPKFDHNGCEIQFRIQGATKVTVKISQRLTKPYSLSNPGGSEADDFLVYLDGKAMAKPIGGSQCTYCTFDTTGLSNETVTEYVIVSGLSEGPHDIRIMKTTEPEWNDREPTPNWITFHGLQLDVGKLVAPSARERKRRIEFIGDSITAGYCNLCKGPVDEAIMSPSLSGGEALETFALSWPTVIREKLHAECSTLAWSGLGLIKNCCGGATYMPEIWTRTLATAQAGGDNSWNFTSWVPNALVINLGTNDGGAGATPEFVDAYVKLLQASRTAYGSGLNVFLACGPMSTTYCDSVHQTIDKAKRMGIKAHFLDQRGFLNGTFGPACCGHPGAQVDAAMGGFTADVIAGVLGWDIADVIV